MIPGVYPQYFMKTKAGIKKVDLRTISGVLGSYSFAIYQINFQNALFVVACTTRIRFPKCFIGTNGSQTFSTKSNTNIKKFTRRIELIHVCVWSPEQCCCIDRSCGSDASMTV